MIKKYLFIGTGIGGIIFGFFLKSLLESPPQEAPYETAYVIHDIVSEDNNTKMYVDPVEMYRVSSANIDVGNARHILEAVTLSPDVLISVLSYTEDMPGSSTTLSIDAFADMLIEDPERFNCMNRYGAESVFKLTFNEQNIVTTITEEMTVLP